MVLLPQEEGGVLNPKLGKKKSNLYEKIQFLSNLDPFLQIKNEAYKLCPGRYSCPSEFKRIIS